MFHCRNSRRCVHPYIILVLSQLASVVQAVTNFQFGLNMHPLTMPIITPTALRKLIATELSSEQLTAAHGRFGSSRPSTGNEQLSVWFGPNATNNIKQVIVSSDDTAGVLFYSKSTFTVVSNLKLSLDSNQQSMLTGHLGDNIATIIPTEVNSKELLGEVFVLLPDGNIGDANLNNLMATTHLATDDITDEDGAVTTFFMNANLDDEPDLANMRIAKLPTSIPLPFGHGIDSTRVTDNDAMTSLANLLGHIDERLMLWLCAMHFSIKHFEGVSLDHDSLNIPEEFFLPLTFNEHCQPQLEVSVSPLLPNFPPATQILSRLYKVQDSNMDSWIQANKPICDPIMARLAPLLGGGPPAPPANTPPTEISVKVARTVTEEKSEIRKQKSLATARLLLGQVDPVADEFIPATLNPDFVDLVEEGTAKTALRAFQQLFKEHIKGRRSNTGAVIHHQTDMPMGVVNLPFTAAFISGHYASSPMHDKDAIVGQNLSIFSFLPAGKDTAGYKRVLDEANTAHGEQMVGTTSTHATKISTNLFSTGEQRTYQNLLSAVSNLHAALTFMLDPTEVKSSRIVTDLEKLFDMLASEEFESWFKFHATGAVTWLCHSILIDVHNVFRHMVLISTSPSYLRAVLEKNTIKASEAVADLELAFATTVQKWNTATNQNALTSYNSEPSTWKIVNSPPDSDSNKKQRGNVDNSGSKEKSPSGSNGNWGRFDTPPPSTRPSNPNMGLVEVSNPMALRSCPTFNGNKRPCHDFMVKGRSCERGRNCRYVHVTARSNPSDLAALQRWADATDGITWLVSDTSRRSTQSSNDRSNNTNNRGRPAVDSNRTLGQPSASG